MALTIIYCIIVRQKYIAFRQHILIFYFFLFEPVKNVPEFKRARGHAQRYVPYDERRNETNKPDYSDKFEDGRRFP